MTDFTYNPEHRGDLDRVRFHIEDTRHQAGPLPDDRNFQDAEIEAILVVEGSWGRAVAACFERLAAAWRKYPNLESDQFGLSRSHISRGYADDADRWRKQYGFADDRSAYAVSRPVYRLDGFTPQVIVDDLP